MQIILLLTGVVIGGIASWFITHIYYNKSSLDQATLFNKLTDEVRKIILADKRESLTVKELNDILIDKVIDKNSPDKFPYKACPKCGSNNLHRYVDYIVDYDVGDEGEPVPSGTPYEAIKCLDCDWQLTELDGEPTKGIV